MSFEVHSMEPTEVDAHGGTTIRVHGSGLSAVSEILVGRVGSAVPQHESDETMTFVAPATHDHVPFDGLMELVVFRDPHGEYVSREDLGLRYLPHGPSIQWVEPHEVHATGGDTVQIGGRQVEHIVSVGVGTAGWVTPQPVGDGIISFVAPALPANTDASTNPHMGLVFLCADGSQVEWADPLVYLGEPARIQHGHDPILVGNDTIVGAAGEPGPPTSDAQAPGRRPSVRLIQPSTGPLEGGPDWIVVSGEHLDNVASVTFGGVSAYLDHRSAREMIIFAPPWNASMGQHEVPVEFHSASDGVNLETVTYRYGPAEGSADPAGLGSLGHAPLQSPGANVGSGSAEQLHEQSPR